MAFTAPRGTTWDAHEGPHEASLWRNPGDHHAEQQKAHTAAASAQTTTAGLEKHHHAGGYDPALDSAEDSARTTNEELAKTREQEQKVSASRHANASTESERGRPDSADSETRRWLMADLMRGLTGRRRTKTNGKFVPAREPRRRTEKPASQAKSMVRAVFRLRVPHRHFPHTICLSSDNKVGLVVSHTDDLFRCPGRRPDRVTWHV
jgi:hypothetical protein